MAKKANPPESRQQAAAGKAPASGTPAILPRPDFHFPGEVGRTFLDSDPARFPKPVQAPKGAPNIVLILIDDCGFGQYGTFGGGIPSPTMDKLAAEGLRYNRFHTTALCSPTRAALITGRNHHSAAFAGITEVATGYDGYTCILPRSCGTMGEVLRQNGYMTAWVGKNHNTPTWETSMAGPFDRWANGLGFPSLIAGRSRMTYYPGTIGLPDAASPAMCNKSWTITAEIAVPAGKAEGMIVTHGGLEGGYGLYLRDGRPTFVYNYLSIDRPTFTAKSALPQRTIPIQFSLGEGLDAGMDIGSPIDFSYKMPFAFTGSIEKVTVELGQLAAAPKAASARAATRRSAR